MTLKQTFLCLCGITVFTLNMQAQATIGSAKQPLLGTLLMLSDGTSGINGENATKGLGLPRVELQAYDKLQMGVTAPEYADKEAHTGLLVYNINTRCDAPTSGLHVWNGSEWIGLNAPKYRLPDPPSLSHPIYNPNVYMVNTIGVTSSVVIPVSKAFAVWKFWASSEGGKKLVPTPFTGSLSVSVVWEEALGGGNNDIVSTPTLSTTNLDETATITVPTTGNPGNAVISLSDGVGVRWSWHIWVTDTPATSYYNGLTWMDRNVGATSATPGDGATLGLYYQWGRPTPLPGYTKLDGTETSVPVTNTPIATALANDGNTPMRQNTLAYAIANPLTFITSNTAPFDWYSTQNAQWDGRWSEDKGVDTECPVYIYDIYNLTNPCPAGWKVPVGSNNSTVSPWVGLTISGLTWNWGYNWPSTVGYYPAAGYRECIERGALLHLDFAGNYWPGTPTGTDTHFLNFQRNRVNSWTATRYRAFGFSVRCVKE